MTMAKKLLSIVLAVVLLVSLAAVAYAAGEEVVLKIADAKVPDDKFKTNIGAADETLVSTEQEGFYAEWENVPAAVQVMLSYDCDHGTDGHISLYVNGEFAAKLPIPSTGSWWGEFPRNEPTNVNIPEGATIRLQVDEGDHNANIRSVILITGTPEEEPPQTGDLGILMYIAAAGLAGGGLVLLKRKK